MCDRVELAFSEVGQEPAAAVPEQTYGTGVGRCARLFRRLSEMVKTARAKIGVDFQFKSHNDGTKSRAAVCHTCIAT